jgi:hypothetical protein
MVCLSVLTIYPFEVGTVDRRFRTGLTGTNGTFKAVVAGEIAAVATGNAVESGRRLPNFARVRQNSPAAVS